MGRSLARAGTQIETSNADNKTVCHHSRSTCKKFPTAKTQMTSNQTNINYTLTHEDIQVFLNGFAGTLELDQIRVDRLPSRRFHLKYDDDMWRRYRQDHQDFINLLLPTVDAIPDTLLQELAWLAIAYETASIREAIVDLFAEAATGMCPAEEYESAALFFGALITNVSRRAAGKPMSGDAKGLMMRWLVLTDPLNVAEDAECVYGQPTGFVN
jgi:hypothetical protein